MSDKEVARYEGTDFAAAGKRARSTATSAGKEGMPVSRVSDTIYEALTVEKPKPRYVLSNNWLMGWFMPQRVPPRRMDRIIAQKPRAYTGRARLCRVVATYDRSAARG